MNSPSRESRPDRLGRRGNDVGRMAAVLDVRQVDRSRRLGSALQALADDLAAARREVALLKAENQTLRERLRDSEDGQEPSCSDSDEMLKSTFTLARVRGIELGLNWSWLIIFGLIVTSLAVEVFPRANPDLGVATYLAMAVVASLLFFASLLAHELGHALQAEREGMQIEGITLWVFGGVAKFTGMFPSAGAEFRIAVAGPAVTFVIALWRPRFPRSPSCPSPCMA